LITSNFLTTWGVHKQPISYPIVPPKEWRHTVGLLCHLLRLPETIIHI